MASALCLCVRRSLPAEPSSRVFLSLDMPSDVGLVEEAVELLNRHCFAGRTPPPSARTQFRLRVALAEALANAIQFGNQSDPAKRVRIIAELISDEIRLGVSDQGVGFDPSRVPEPTSPESLEGECGRGLFLIRHLVDRLEFNDQGNTIWMTLPRS